jgi:two-component system, OmpR family, response regulator
VRVLLIEDDPQAAGYIVKGMLQSGHLTDHAPNGRDGLLVAATSMYDVMIIDRMLPGLDGLSVVRTLRSMGNQTPVLLLSALGDVDDRVEGLKAGGDDYLVKPFAFSELLARLEALPRRRDATVPATRLAVGDLEMDLLARTTRRAGRLIELKPREFRLLEVLMRNAGHIVTRTMLRERVWDYHFDPQTNVIDVHMGRLRTKIDKDFATTLIHTVRGAGYTIRAPEGATGTRRS